MKFSATLLMIALLIAFFAPACEGEQRAAISPDSTILASVQADCTVVLREVRSGKKIATLYEPSRECEGIFGSYGAVAQVPPTPWVSFSPDGRFLATDLGGYGTLDVWRVQDRRRIASFSGAGHITSLEFSPDSRLMLVVGSEGKSAYRNNIALFDMTTFRRLLRVSEGTDKGFRKVALSPDERTLMALVGPKRGRPDKVRLWDIERPGEPVTLKGQAAWFLPDGNLLLITDSGGSAVWDIKAGRIIRSEQAVEPPATARDLTADNVAQSVADGKWSWTVFVKGDRQRIEGIKCVEYKLHPSFPNPVRRICKMGDSRRPFGLSAAGWGTFTIPIRVFMKDGTIRHVKHQLRF